MKITYRLFVSARLRGSERGQFTAFWQRKHNPLRNWRSHGKLLQTQRPAARLCLPSPQVREAPALSFPAPTQSHLSSLTEKVWNRLKVGPQTKKPWHGIQPVWNTHTKWAQKGRRTAVRGFEATLFGTPNCDVCVHTCAEGRVGGFLSLLFLT